MAWLSDYTRRKIKVVNNPVSDYQMKLTIHQSGLGPDTSTDIYLGGYIRSDFADLRFTGPDQVTLLSYWIESITSGVATVWIKVPILVPTNNIYIYYDNPLQTISASDGRNTFIVFDDFSTGSSEQWTMTNVTADRVTNHRLNINAVNGTPKAYLDKGSDIGDFEFIFDHTKTSTTASEWLGAATSDSNVGDQSVRVNSIGAYDGQIGVGTIQKWCYLRQAGVTFNNQTNAGLNNTHYWDKLTRVNGVHTYNGYSNSDRTTLVWSVSTTRAGIINQRYIFGVDSLSDSANIVTGWITGIRIRKLASPEPTFGVSGNEELNITAIDMILDKYSCLSSCAINAYVTWHNYGNSNITFTPAVLIDGTTLAYGSNITIAAGTDGSSGAITTPILSSGVHSICPYPN